MRYTDILLEYNRDQTVKNYGEKILAVAIKDRTVPWLVIFQDQPEAGNVKVQQVLKSPEGQQTALNYLMGVIEQSDPTKNKNYAQAITRLYSMGGTLFEDISATLSQYLVKFDKLKNKKKIPAPYNDFMRYKTLNDFMSYVETLPDPDSEIEQQKVAELQVPADVKYDVVYGQFDTQLRITSDCVVLIPRNSQAGYWWAKEYPKKGVTNRWCTAWEGSNSRFDYYSKQGPLYIIIPAKRNDDNEKFQFHFETKQFMDYQDHQIGDQGMEALVSRFPSLTDVFKSQAAKYSILPLMSEEYKTAVRAHAKPASAELDQMIVKYQDKIAEFGFSSLGDYGINLQDEARQDLVPLIKDYLDQCRAALLSKTGVWKQIVTKLGTERNEDKLEVILNTDPTLKSVMENSEAGRIVADIVNGSSDISRRIDATHLQDLLLRDPLFRFVMRQIPKLYATLLNDLVPGTKVNESDYDDDEETTDEGFFVCIGSEDDGGFVGMLTKEDNRWREVALRGTAPHNWGGSYMSYLTPNDVMQHIRNDYSRGHDVKGPFFDEQKAIEYAYNQYGLGDEEDMSEDTIDMPFGSISGKDVDIGLQYQSEQRAYSGLKRLGLVDTSEQFLILQEIAQLLTNSSNFHLFAFDTNPVRAYAKFIEMIGWDKNNPTKYNKQGVAEAVWDRPSQSYVPRDGRTFGQTNHPREEHCDACGAATGHAGPGEDSNVDDEGNVYCDDCYADQKGVAEDRLDELSPKTLGSYINKATKDAGTLGYGLGDINARPGKYKDSPDVVKDVKHSFNNRIKGVEKASHRLTKEQGVAEGHADQQRKVFKKNGHPVGEVGIDRESSPGNGQWYMKYYATGDDFSGYDSMEEAVADLKHLVNQFKAEGVAEAAPSTELQDKMRQVRPKGKGITRTELQNAMRRKGKKQWHCPECATYDDNVHGKFCSKYKPKEQGVAEGKEELHTQLQSINQKLKLMRGGPVGEPNSMAFVEKRKELLKQKEQILSQLKQGVAEGLNSKQEVIDHFVRQGKTAAQGAAAWERGWRGNDKKKPNPFDPNYKVKPVDNKRYGEVDETNEPDDEDDGLIAGKYTPDEFDAMVSRVGQLAKAHEKRSDPGDISKLAARLAGIEGKK